MDNTSKGVIDLIRKAVDDSCHIDQQLLKQANWSEVIAFCLSQGVVGICYYLIEKIMSFSNHFDNFLNNFLR